MGDVRTSEAINQHKFEPNDAASRNGKSKISRATSSISCQIIGIRAPPRVLIFLHRKFSDNESLSAPQYRTRAVNNIMRSASKALEMEMPTELGSTRRI